MLHIQDLAPQDQVLLVSPKEWDRWVLVDSRDNLKWLQRNQDNLKVE